MKKLLLTLCCFGLFGCTEHVIIGDLGQAPSCEVSAPPCTLSGKLNGSPTSGCQPEYTINVVAPQDGSLAAGTKGALFARIKFSTSCGPLSFALFSVNLVAEQPTDYCAGSCGAEDAWNFSHPLLTNGHAVFTSKDGFHLAQMFDGKMSLEAHFDQPFTIAAGEDAELEFLVDIAKTEAVPGSLFGKRFRASLGLATYSGSTWNASDSSVEGGYQLITP